MFTIAVQAEFSAAHAIAIQGRVEPVHGHNWLVTATLAGHELDRDGLLLDFHLAERHLREIAATYQNGNLNEHEPFRTELNPTAENIAKHFADELIRRLKGDIPPTTAVTSVRITEAPGCAATYYPPSTATKQVQPA